MTINQQKDQKHNRNLGEGGGSHPLALNTAFEGIRVVDRGGERRSGILDVDSRGEEGVL